jgi:HEAT repeat protein
LLASVFIDTCPGSMPLILLLVCVFGLTGTCRAAGSQSDEQALVQRLVERLRGAEGRDDSGEATYTREDAAYRLGRLGPRAKAAVPALLRATEDGNEFPLRDEAVKALGAIAPGDPIVLKRIGDLLADRSERGELSATARKTLAKVGPLAIPVLVDKLKARWDDLDEEEILGTWGWSASALAEIGRPALPAVLEALKDPPKRMGAVEALGAMGPGAAVEAVPALITHADDSDRHVRCSVFAALQRLGPAARQAIPVLTSAARDDPWCDQLAAQALKAVCPACPSASK